MYFFKGRNTTYNVSNKPAVSIWSSGSGLADFFQEPKLGTTWYNPNGPTPTFDMKQTNQTVYEARLGSDAFMGCKVSLLNIITVWYEKKYILSERKKNNTSDSFVFWKNLI